MFNKRNSNLSLNLSISCSMTFGWKSFSNSLCLSSLISFSLSFSSVQILHMRLARYLIRPVLYLLAVKLVQFKYNPVKVFLKYMVVLYLMFLCLTTQVSIIGKRMVFCQKYFCILQKEFCIVWSWFSLREVDGVFDGLRRIFWHCFLIWSRVVQCVVFGGSCLLRS